MLFLLKKYFKTEEPLANKKINKSDNYTNALAQQQNTCY